MCTRKALVFLSLAVAATTSAAAARGAEPVTDAPGLTFTRSVTLGETITDQQRARLAEKLALVDGIMSAIAATPDRSSDDQRRSLRERLYSAPLAQLRAMGTPSSLEAASTALAKTAVSMKELGDPLSDLVYRPITPCRYVDTRNVGGPIVGTRDFDLSNTGTTYGGSGACDPKATAPFSAPSLIAAINVNVTIVGPGIAPGFVGARPAGSTNTTSLVNWYEGGPNVQAANAGVLSTGGTGQIEFFGSPVNIVVDVLGIFTMPEHAAPKVIQTIQWAASAGAAGGNFPIPADRPVQIIATVLTPAYRGVSQVSLLQCCGTTPQFLEWVGLNSPSDGSITKGFGNGVGMPILKMDYTGQMLLEVNDASSVRLHNASPVSQQGLFTIVEY